MWLKHLVPPGVPKQEKANELGKRNVVGTAKLGEGNRGEGFHLERRPGLHTAFHSRRQGSAREGQPGHRVLRGQAEEGAAWPVSTAEARSSCDQDVA